jgi:hypothetical protein
MSEYADFSRHSIVFFHGPRLLRRRIPIDQPSVSPRPRPAQTIPHPPRPSRVRVKRPPALPQYPPLPPPRPPISAATPGPRIRVAAGGAASRIAPARPPVLAAPRSMPEAWRRLSRPVPQRPVATGEGVVVSTSSVGLLGAGRPDAGSPPTAVTSAGSVPTGSNGATRIVSYVPIGVLLNARPAPARPTARAYPHPIRIVRPRTP